MDSAPLIIYNFPEQPDTLVFWRRNGAVAERAHAASGSLRATVRVRNATRAELDAHYECLAQNADVTEPLSASVLVTMYREYFKPRLYTYVTLRLYSRRV